MNEVLIMIRDIDYLNKTCKYLDIIEVDSDKIIVRSLVPYNESQWDYDCNYFIEKYSTSLYEEKESSYKIINDRLAIIYI